MSPTEASSHPGALFEQPELIKVWFDGGRGLFAYGSYEIDGGPLLKHKSLRQEFGDQTCNQAEYQSLIAALKWLSQHIEFPQYSRLDIWTDSMLVCQQVRGRWKCRKPHLQTLRDEIRGLLQPYGGWQISWHRRTNNVSRFGH